jgi:transcriptional regulator with XRE-family HTH domain
MRKLTLIKHLISLRKEIGYKCESQIYSIINKCNTYIVYICKQIYSMRERLIKFLEIENLTSAKFADDIGVQRSSVSHILSGRNNPSYDFIQKILQKYKSLNAEWLLLGTGNMKKPVMQGELFENTTPELNISKLNESTEQNIDIEANKEVKMENKDLNSIINKSNIVDNHGNIKNIEKIIFFFKDNTFEIFLPSK